MLDACIVGSSKAEIQAAVLESERRLAEKHARLEGAVVQVWITMRDRVTDLVITALNFHDRKGLPSHFMQCSSLLMI